MRTYKDILSESSLSRLWAMTQSHTSGAITGYRHNKTRAENQEANRMILGYLRERGYSLTKIKGSYIEDFGGPNPVEVGEASFFVVNHKVEGGDGGQLEADLRKLGEHFDQDSVLVVPVGGEDAYLVGTSDREDAFPGAGKVHPSGSGRYGAVSGQFLSRVRGREFAFEHEEVPPPTNVMGRWGQHLVIKEFIEEMEKEKKRRGG